MAAMFVERGPDMGVEFDFRLRLVFDGLGTLRLAG
jgi:hypothetical protein